MSTCDRRDTRKPKRVFQSLQRGKTCRSVAIRKKLTDFVQREEEDDGTLICLPLCLQVSCTSMREHSHLKHILQLIKSWHKYSILMSKLKQIPDGTHSCGSSANVLSNQRRRVNPCCHLRLERYQLLLVEYQYRNWKEHGRNPPF